MSMACGALSTLPSELRITIYEYVLAFDHAIKLRQYVSGADKTNILRTNKQIHSESLAVLYETNVISVTRNDFCFNTSPSLKTPVDGLHIRHLRLTSFGESIACGFLLKRCECCQDHARGLLDLLAEMPQLKTVKVDFSTQTSAFWRFRSMAEECPTGTSIECTAVGVYRLRGARFQHVDFTFEHRPIATVWPRLIHLCRIQPSEGIEEDTLEELRNVDVDVPDKLWLMHCARQSGHLEELTSKLIVKCWVDEAKMSTLSPGDRSSALHTFTVAIQAFQAGLTAPQARRYLRSLRELSAV
jgi:hypothetical protein